MELTVLAVPDCPNVALLLQRLEQALPEARAPVRVHVITTDAEAARFGMHGSPTLLANGMDPFAAAGVGTSVSCRIYGGADGRREGAPSVEQLREVLQRG
ncbi:thioredoxin family protein [Streptomyces sp. H27-S2]|uniref:thioredoxin family protein n=1 Tax=Streptomyces antarcticus TaxID=2996458 RepID=UPI0022714F30|nr:thioredoxin family protein [Streptomyces sp. H27-S2]MCY0950668.1 thioredoxin family protein [Streptomyces sp. H27-S2]